MFQFVGAWSFVWGAKPPVAAGLNRSRIFLCDSDSRSPVKSFFISHS